MPVLHENQLSVSNNVNCHKFVIFILFIHMVYKLFILCIIILLLKKTKNKINFNLKSILLKLKKCFHQCIILFGLHLNASYNICTDRCLKVSLPVEFVEEGCTWCAPESTEPTELRLLYCLVRWNCFISR